MKPIAEILSEMDKNYFGVNSNPNFLRPRTRSLRFKETCALTHGVNKLRNKVSEGLSTSLRIRIYQLKTA